MKTFAKQMMIAAAITAAATPAVAAPVANPAASLSVGHAARTGAIGGHAAELAGGINRRTAIFGLVGVIVIVAVILIATNKTPRSV